MRERRNEELIRSDFNKGDARAEELLRLMIAYDRKVMAEIDKVLVMGEGELSEAFVDMLGIDYVPGLYRWIRVREDGGAGRTIATFYLHTVDGALEQMFLARARKGMPPNPGDQIEQSMFMPSMIEACRVFGDTQARNKDDFLHDHRGSQGIKGMRPTVRVRMIHSGDGDHRWQFPYFKVRSTKLAPVLLAFRNAGVQRVRVSEIRDAVQRMQ